MDKTLEFLNEKLTVIVVGFDDYVDVWNHCFDLMNRFWKDRPRTILVDSELNPSYDKVDVINAGSEAEWSKKSKKALGEVSTEYILLLLEDFFISKPVDNKRILKAIELMDADQLDYYQVLIQLSNQSWAKGKSYKGDKHIRIIPSDKKYPINLQAAIWRKDFFEKCLGDGNYNTWKFEMDHMYDVVNIDKINCVLDNSNILNIIHSVVQSKYLRSSVKALRKIGCIIHENERPILSRKDDFKYNLKLFMYGIIPKTMHSYAKKIGKIINIDFVTDRLSRDK